MKAKIAGSSFVVIGQKFGTKYEKRAK